MLLDKNLKEYVIIGVLLIFVSLILLTREILQLNDLLKSDYNLSNRSSLIKQHCHKLVAFVAMSFASIFIIIGFNKKHLVRWAPWLLVIFAVMTFAIFLIVGNLMTLAFSKIEFMLYTMAITGLECVVVYPLCTLFEEIRRARVKKLRRQGQKRNLTIKSG